jgi:peptidoglycan lytic transglycosylase
LWRLKVMRMRGAAKAAQAGIGGNAKALRSTTSLALLAVPLAACSFGTPSTDPNLGVSASPRVASGRALPKGGGHYKVGKPYKVRGRTYVPRANPDYDRTGIASWYGSAFHGRRTANGEIYDMYALTAGHPTLPLPSYAYVTNRDNGRTILVRINDRGPYVGNRLIDLSWRSARELGFTRKGLARVRVRYAGRAPLSGSDAAERRHLAAQSWHRGNVNVARAQSSPIEWPSQIARSSQIETGSLGADSPPWSVMTYRQTAHNAQTGTALQRGALGGPEHNFVVVGPFATRAEAARMRYTLNSADSAAAATVEPVKTGITPAFQLRVGPLDDVAAQNVADEIRPSSEVARRIVR